MAGRPGRFERAMFQLKQFLGEVLLRSSPEKGGPNEAPGAPNSARSPLRRPPGWLVEGALLCPASLTRPDGVLGQLSLFEAFTS